MSKSEYTTAATLPVTQLHNPAVRALVIQFAARCAHPRFGAQMIAALRRAC